MYEVLIAFTDNIGGGVYRVGDNYPKDGVKPTKSRIEYLSGYKNKFGKPVIKPIGNNEPEYDEPKPCRNAKSFDEPIDTDYSM